MPETDFQRIVLQNWGELKPTLDEWCQELEMRATNHRMAAQRLRTLNRLLGGVNVALAAITATTIYAALNQKLQNLSVPFQLLITFVSVLPAISAGLQKEWKVVERENGHTVLARDCRVLLKELKFLIAVPPQDRRKALSEWHQRFTEVISRPAIPPGR